MKPAPIRTPRSSAKGFGDAALKRIWFAAIVFITAGLVLIFGAKLEQIFPSNPAVQTAQVLPTAKPTAAVAPTISPSPQIKFTPAPSISPTMMPSPISPPSPREIAKTSTVQTYLGHLPYGEGSPDRLVSIGKFVRENYEREEALDIEAAQAFQVMVEAARSQGVQLMGISGFRAIADQQTLFEKQIEKRGSAEAAAKLSAPPGHSEHHTGYAIDITDASRTDVDLKMAFEETAAYQWLVANAHQYGFEQSFPRNNAQGVSYEPWHWRFVGSARSAQVFAAARNTGI